MTYDTWLRDKGDYQRIKRAYIKCSCAGMPLMCPFCHVNARRLTCYERITKAWGMAW